MTENPDVIYLEPAPGAAATGGAYYPDRHWAEHPVEEDWVGYVRIDIVEDLMTGAATVTEEVLTMGEVKSGSSKDTT